MNAIQVHFENNEGTLGEKSSSNFKPGNLYEGSEQVSKEADAHPFRRCKGR